MDENYNKEKTFPPIGFGQLRLMYNQNEAEDYIFLDVNAGFEKLTGLKREDIEGKRASEIFSGQRSAQFDWVTYYDRVVRSGRTQETTQWIAPYGRYCRITVVPSNDGFFSIIVADAYQGATAQDEAENKAVLEGLETMFNRTHDAMLLIEYRDGGFIYLRNNQLHKKLTGFSHINGYTPVTLLGEELGQKLINYYVECINTARPLSYEQKYDFSPGKRIWHTEITPIFSGGEIRYLLSCSKDLTELKAIQDENELLTRRLQSMFEHHSAIMLIIEPISGRIIDGNPAACGFYGYTRQELQDLLITDINTLTKEEVAARRALAYNRKEQHFVFPHRLKSGETRLVDVYSSPISDGEGGLLYSIIFDVTERELYRSALFEEKEVLRTTLRSIGDGVVATDGHGLITSLNNVAQELTGWHGTSAVGRSFTEVFHLQNEDTGLPVENPIQKVLETGRIVGLANHTVLLSRHNQAIPIADSAAPIVSEGGHILGVVMVFRDVTSEKEQTDQIRYLSYHDPLTGLYNRRYVEETMHLVDTEQNLPISVIMGDVNGLKITNDVFGHEAGDSLLKYMAKSLKSNCHRTDIIARWGGDEVVIFMPRTSLSEAEEIIQRLKSDYIDVEEVGLRMSISFGCASKESMEENIQAVMRRAEEYMYHQKLLDGKSYRNAIINTLLATLYEKSNETEEHSKRMERYCHMIGERLQLSSKEMNELTLLAVLHDIGKVSIDPNILQKPSSLSAAEWVEMKRHTEIGYRIAQATPELAIVADFILSHHERWDGKGYPRGLKEEDIPLPCRILAVTDAFDAMTNDRVYRRAMSREEALLELEKNKGTQFDPMIAGLFIEAMRQGKFCRRSKPGGLTM